MPAKLRRGWGSIRASRAWLWLGGSTRAVFGPRTQVAIPTEGYLISRQWHLLVLLCAQTGLREPGPGFNLHSH